MKWPQGARPALAVLVAVCCLLAAVVPAAGAAPIAAGDGSGGEFARLPADAAPVAQVDDDGQADGGNGTADTGGPGADDPVVVRHADPETIDDPRNLGRLESYLLASLGERLNEGATEISRGEYETARKLVGDDYEDLLGRYVSLVDDGDGEVGRELATARDEHRAFLDAVESYESSYASYRDAKARGDEPAARQLARELERDADRTAASRERLNASAASIEAGTGLSLADARGHVAEVGDDVAERQAAVRSAEFEPTLLVVDDHDAVGSYLDPIRISARLTDANGTPIADANASFAVGERRLDAAVGPDGTVELAYRPTTAPVGPGELPVEYLPSTTSAYLGAGTTVAVTVEPVSPTLSIRTASGAATYGRPVVANGTLTAAGVPVADVPLRVTVGRSTVAATRTDANGAFGVAPPLPAEVPTGDRQLTVAVAGEGLAIGAAADRTAVTVGTTGTTVSIRTAALADGDTAVAVRGVLGTADGRPLGGRVVQLASNGTTVATLATNADGVFGTTLPLVALGWDGRGRLSLVAGFDGRGTNLATAESDPVTVTGTPVGEPVDPLNAVAAAVGLDDPTALLVALGAGVVLVGSVVAVRARRRRRSVVDVADVVEREADDDDADSRTREGDGARDRRTAAPDGRPASTGPGPVDETTLVATLLAAAEAALDDEDYDGATRYAYLAARRATAAAGPLADRGTPREFVEAARDREASTDEQLAALTALTGAFERTAFTSHPVDHDAAARALRTATGLVDLLDAGGGASAGDGSDAGTRTGARRP